MQPSWISIACGHLKCVPPQGDLKAPHWVKASFTSGFDPQTFCWGHNEKPWLVLSLGTISVVWFPATQEPDWHKSTPSKQVSTQPSPRRSAACKYLATRASGRVAQVRAKAAGPLNWWSPAFILTVLPCSSLDWKLMLHTKNIGSLTS